MTRDKSDSAPAADAQDSFLARWSRRKRAARQPEPAHGAEVADTAAAESAEPGAASADPPAPADDRASEHPATAAGDGSATGEDLPPPETLSADSDFTAYLGKRVSREVRRAALRQMFSASKFNVRDGLDDYDEDYTNFQSLGDTVTAHMRHHVERLRQRAMAREGTGAAAGDDSTETSTVTGDKPPRSRPGGVDEAGEGGSSPDHGGVAADPPTAPPTDQEHDDTA